MSPDVDSGTILYVVGVLFGLAAFAYFLPDVVFGLSITVRAALLLLAFVGLLLAGLALERDVLDLVAFALAAIAYVVWLYYVVSRYDPGRTAVFLLLALSAALFVGLGYGLREVEFVLDRRDAAAAVGGLVVAALVLVAADALAGGVAYEVGLNDSATVEVPERAGDRQSLALVETRVGTVTASNDFVFREPLDWPRTSGCLVGFDAPSDERALLEVGPSRVDAGDSIGGRSEVAAPITARLPVRTNRTGPLEVAVERGGSCEATRDSPTLLVFVGDDAPGGPNAGRPPA